MSDALTRRARSRKSKSTQLTFIRKATVVETYTPDTVTGNNNRKSATVPFVGGTFVGLAIAGAFIAGHAFWPGATSTNITTTTTPNNVIVAPKLGANAGMALGENTIADIAQTANLSVVNIDTRSSVTVSDSPFMGMQDFSFFFGGQNPFHQSPHQFERKGTGSGVIFRQDGYILTNNHVVGGAQQIKVTLADKRTFDGKVVGRDKFTDLALVKIDATGLPAAQFGTSKNLRSGDWAIAIGSPVGLDHTVTLGIISALGRSLSDLNNNVQLIQTDAAINPGNSGGPLLNIHGQVIGINTAIRGDAQSIGFAIPVDVAKETADELLTHKTIARAYVGILMQDIDDKLAKSLGVSETTKGVLIRKTKEGGPADEAGLQTGDIIQKVDGQSVSASADVQTIVRKHKPGDSLNFLVLRDSKFESVEVKIGDLPNTDSE
jgi:serine protease Do